MNLTKTLASIKTTIPSSKILTYPTRLASAWQPEIMEINLPECEIQRPEIYVSVSPGSTRDLKIKSKNFYYKIYVVNKYRHTVAAIGGQWCGITG